MLHTIKSLIFTKLILLYTRKITVAEGNSQFFRAQKKIFQKYSYAKRIQLRVR